MGMKVRTVGWGGRAGRGDTLEAAESLICEGENQNKFSMNVEFKSSSLSRIDLNNTKKLVKHHLKQPLYHSR